MPVYESLSLNLTTAMADNQMDGLTNCPVCYEEYLESGDFVPRILPCHHSVCEKCVKALLTDSRLTCPECRKRHHATAGAESFPQKCVGNTDVNVNVSVMLVTEKMFGY